MPVCSVNMRYISLFLMLTLTFPSITDCEGFFRHLLETPNENILSLTHSANRGEWRKKKNNYFFFFLKEQRLWFKNRLFYLLYGSSCLIFAFVVNWGWGKGANSNVNVF